MFEGQIAKPVTLISQRDFELVAKQLKQISGIHLTPEKRTMVSARLHKRMKALGVEDCQQYLTLVSAEPPSPERNAFISALTTNTTRFCRENHHFTHFGEQVLPDLIEFARSGGRVRLWSAACSTGEEPYDLAFNIFSTCPEIVSLDLRILATDIDRAALQRAELGQYSLSALEGLPQGFQRTFFETNDAPSGMATVRSDIRNMIAFRPLNLDSDWPFNGPFDVILCRNVAIYFADDTSNRLWRRLASFLKPNGILYSGHSETLPNDVTSAATQEGPGTLRFPMGYPLRNASDAQIAFGRKHIDGS